MKFGGGHLIIAHKVKHICVGVLQKIWVCGGGGVLYAGLFHVWANVVWQTTIEIEYNVVTNFKGFVA